MGVGRLLEFLGEQISFQDTAFCLFASVNPGIPEISLQPL